ncbi:MAG: hypothetical protein WCE54_04850 [Ignavibacteriaceae bacterium]
MRNSIILFPLFILVFISGIRAGQDTSSTFATEIKSDSGFYRDIYPDTWVGTDAIGRTMPDYSETGPVKKDHRRVVGIFYVTQHLDQSYYYKKPFTADVSRILKEDPAARLDGNDTAWGPYHSYFWSEPEAGYYLSMDKYVDLKDMSMLSDAGVDLIILDVTNGYEYWSQWDVLFSAMEKMKSEGNKVPQFCFWGFNGPVITVVQDLYDKIYKTGKYKDLWFYWDGKPLLLYNSNPNTIPEHGGVQNPNPHFDSHALLDKSNLHYGDSTFTKKYYNNYSEEVKKFFTLRTMWWGYYKWEGKRFAGTENNWSFGYDLGDKNLRNLNPDELVSPHGNKKEEAAVTPAQHATSLIGKSWTRENGEPELNEYDLPVPTYVPWLGKKVDNPEDYGIYFQERWNEALKADPQFIYINDWNEWTAGKYNPEINPIGNPKNKEKTVLFMRRQSNYYFVDQYNSEFNRDIAPMKGGYTDNYYMQMAENIRYYKGIRPIPVSKGFSNINFSKGFVDWEKIKIEYRDTRGDTCHRDYNGFGGLHYVNNSGRNDIITCKVAVNKKNIYFFAETSDTITSFRDKNWMLLLIDADNNHDTGWYGYDFLINQNIINSSTTTVMKYDSLSQSWSVVGKIKYHCTGNKLEINVPRMILGLPNSNSFTFDFHWADNPEDLKTPISFCINGDSAPNRRFNYRFIWKKE